jgi:hypothetical protein
MEMERKGSTVAGPPLSLGQIFVQSQLTPVDRISGGAYRVFVCLRRLFAQEARSTADKRVLIKRK